jgi:hypothetical protein
MIHNDRSSHMLEVVTPADQKAIHVQYGVHYSYPVSSTPHPSSPKRELLAASLYTESSSAVVRVTTCILLSPREVLLRQVRPPREERAADLRYTSCSRIEIVKTQDLLG